MNFMIHIACTAALIGGLDKKDAGKATAYTSWTLPGNSCSVRYETDDVVTIKCLDGEKFILPRAQCAVSLLKTKDKKQ